MTTPASAGAVQLRPATRDDLPAIVAMRDDLNALELRGCAHASIQKLTLDQFAALWGPSFDDPNYCWRIVEVDRQPIGYGLIYLQSPRTDPPGAFIHWAYVRETERRRGLGQALLDELIGWARARGANRLELQFIEGNEIARRFWTKSGFRPYAFKCVRYLS